MNSNIELFLRDKPHVMRMQTETMKESFPRFWEWIGAEGDLDAALAELDVAYHERGSSRPEPRDGQRRGAGRRQGRRTGQGQGRRSSLRRLFRR
jgi:hypothetical protein